MPDFMSIDKQIDDWLTLHQDEIVQEAQNLIKIPSVKGEPGPGAPYGIETRQALEHVITIGEKFGFKSKMLDGHAAHLEFGSGEELIGVLSHVDVVPAGSDWKHNPFGGELEDGKIYGRGAIDDKGPTISGLYALIAIKELGLSITKRFRLIIGADEESGFGCMHHYFDVAKEEMPTMGFTPDGRFPVIYAEKGIATPVLTTKHLHTAEHIKLLSLTAGQRSNMVPNRAHAVLSFDLNPELAKAIHVQLNDKESIEAELNDGIDSVLHVTATGIGAHASLPHEGINAVGVLCDALLKINELTFLKPLLETLKSYAIDNSGACLGIAGNDEPSGALTINLGVLETDANGSISATFSVRYPVTWAGNDIKTKLESAAKERGFHLTSWSDAKPLHVPKDSPFLTTLLEVYRAETGDMQPPQSMGGGTYARVLTQGVAFGPNFPGFPDNAHQADEYWTVEDLMKATRIYAKALIRLGS